MVRFVSLSIFLLMLSVTCANAQQVRDKKDPSTTLDRAEQKTSQKAAERQKVYRIPFGSRGNAIRLQVANNSSRAARHLTLKVKDIPEWMELTPTSFTIGDLEPQKSTTASFTFHVDEKAPINKKTTLRFVAEGAKEYNWEKEIAMTVAAPTEVKLKQNYPNPFNPSTTISYELPTQMEVRVTVFNILGQRIVTLANEFQQAGSQEVRWDGSRFASGLYFYRIVADAPGMEKIIRHKKMLLIK